MSRFFVRRMLILPIALALVNFLGFGYAHIAGPLRAGSIPHSVQSGEIQPLLPAYISYVGSLVGRDFSMLLAVPGSIRTGPVALGETVWNAGVASLGLIAISSTASILVGMAIAMLAVRDNPPRVSRWFTLVSTVGMAMPSFYIGSLFILAAIYYVLWKGPGTPIPLPISGFGWDKHLVMPALALMVRPTVQVAQLTANLLANELSAQYVVAARSLGYTWRAIRIRFAFRPIIAPVILTIAGTLRLLVGELVLVEWLFQWPGLGRLLAWTLVPPQLSSAAGSPLFLNPPVIALILTMIAAFFLFSDFLAAFLVRVFDPRLRTAEVESVQR